MLSNLIKHTSLAMITLLAICLNAQAGDLDDGIEIDDKIEKWDTIDRPGINISYIKRSAKASASSGSQAFNGNGDMAIGGFINQPGAQVGDVTIIFDGEDINAISE
jgi:hypothetical protein